MNDLGHVATGDATAFKGFQGHKAVRGTLRVADRDWVSVQVRSKQGGCKEKKVRGAGQGNPAWMIVFFPSSLAP